MALPDIIRDILSCCLEATCIVVFLCYRSLRTRSNFRLIICAILCDISSLLICLYQFPRVDTFGMWVLCYFQAISQTVLVIWSSQAMLCMSFLILFSMFTGKGFDVINSHRFLVSICFFIPLLTASPLVLVIIASCFGTVGSSDPPNLEEGILWPSLCWYKEEFGLLRLLVLYSPIVFCILMSAILGIVAFVKFKLSMRHFSIRKSYSKVLKDQQLALRLLVFPFVTAICWSPAAIHRTVQFFAGVSPPFLSYMHLWMANLWSVGFFLAFFSNALVLKNLFNSAKKLSKALRGKKKPSILQMDEKEIKIEWDVEKVSAEAGLRI